MFEAVAQYVYCGDPVPVEWMSGRLDQAEERGDIHDGAVLGQWMGGHLPTVLFTFRYSLARHPDNGVNFDEAMLLAVNLAESIVGESDVQVLGLKAVPA